MKNTQNQISATEARQALDSLAQANDISVKSFRPPIWLNIMASLFLGVETFAAPMSSGNSLWTFVTLVATGGLMLSIGLWFYLLRRGGIKVKLMPVTLASKLFNLVQGLIVAFLIVASIEWYKQGATWIPYLTAPLNTLLMSYILHHFPSGNWVAKESSK